MDHLEEFISSGLLELYVLGLTSPEETLAVQAMEKKYPEVKVEIDHITERLVTCAEQAAPPPSATVRPLFMATIDFMQRMEKGEEESFPPVLNESSTLQDYRPWLEREDMVLADDYDGIYIRLIGHSPGLISAIVWIDDETPFEIHEAEYEKFLIVEGSCDIIIDEKPHHLVPGDYMCIPLYAGHIVKVTSDVPCKVILQRQAA